MVAHTQRAERYNIAAYATVGETAKLLGDKQSVEGPRKAGKAITGLNKTLSAIAIQANAEAYVGTRVDGT